LTIDGDPVRSERVGPYGQFCCEGCRQVFDLLSQKCLLELLGDVPRGASSVSVTDAPAASGDLERVQLVVTGMWCASCAWVAEKYVSRLYGVRSVSVDYATGLARIHYAPELTSTEAIRKRFEDLGYGAQSRQHDFGGATLAADHFQKQRDDLLLRLGVALFFAMNIMTLTWTFYYHYLSEPGRVLGVLLQRDLGSLPAGTGMDPQVLALLNWIIFASATVVLFYSGWPILRNGLLKLKYQAANMDTLIAMGALVTYGYSLVALLRGEPALYFDAAAMLVTFILLGRYLELAARGKAVRALRKLLELGARDVRRLGPGGEKRVPVERVRPGDRILVKAGERIPLDGIIRAGATAVDESMISGESRPVDKREGDEVVGATLNLTAPVEVEVTRVGSDTVLAQIVRLVEQTIQARPAIQRLADRVAAWFVPAVLAVAVLTILGWIAAGRPLSAAMLKGVAVVVIACPCALGLAVPLTLVAVASRGAERRILVRDAEVLEGLRQASAVVFDKTGTLTEGRLLLTDVVLRPGGNFSEREFLQAVASVEHASEHHLAQAIAQLASEQALELLPVLEFVNFPGEGVRAEVELPGAAVGVGRSRAYVGKLDFLEARGVACDPELRAAAGRLQAAGKTVSAAGWAGRMEGLLAFADEPRENSSQVVAALLREGYEVAMITGDDPRTAARVAEQVGIRRVIAGVKPQEKVAEIRKLQQAGKKVVMVGDGLNDAPALVAADVGIAIGTGAEVSLEASDITLLGSDLEGVREAFHLARQASRRIRQNLFWASAYNLAGIPLAALGLVNPVLAAAAMVLSSLSVVLNSLRGIPRLSAS